MPDVSVIIPTYERRSLLEGAVRSCFEAATSGNGEAPGIEVVVVDDGSTDGTREWLRQRSHDDERVRAIFQEHQGAQVARTRGLQEASGTYVKFLDSDDQLTAGALAHEVERLQETGAAISYGDLRIREADGKERVFHQEIRCDLVSGILEGTTWTHPHVFLYRRNAIADLLWNRSVPYEQDYAFAIQVATQGLESVYAGRTVGLHNRHTGPRISTTTKSAAGVAERLQRRIALIAHGVRRLDERGFLHTPHRQAAARGMWRWARMMALFDFAAFLRASRYVQRINPGFRPARSSVLLRAFDRLASPVVTECLLYPLRKGKQFLAR